MFQKVINQFLKWHLLAISSSLGDIETKCGKGPQFSLLPPLLHLQPLQKIDNEHRIREVKHEAEAHSGEEAQDAVV